MCFRRQRLNQALNGSATKCRESNCIATTGEDFSRVIINPFSLVPRRTVGSDSSRVGYGETGTFPLSSSDRPLGTKAATLPISPSPCGIPESGSGLQGPASSLRAGETPRERTIGLWRPPYLSRSRPSK